MLQTKLLTPLSGHHHVYLDRHFCKDCEMWIRFLSYTCVNNAALCRPFVDVDQATDARNFCFYTDASSWVGFGGIFNNQWIVGGWGSQFVESQEPSIAFLELFALTAGVPTWGHYIQNTKVIIHCDNQSVVGMVINLTSKCKKCMKLIRLITLNSILYKQRIVVHYLKSESNRLADSLSRLDFDRFWRNAPVTMSQVPDQIPDDLWPIEKIWFND